jgi:molybdopterin/thiamine biosynthesis adenylyltransferase
VILVGTMAAALWIIGAVMRAPVRARLIMIGILLTGVIALHVALPDGHPLRQATGGEAAFWLMLLAVAAVAALYARGLRWLRARAEAQAVATPRTGTFTEAELNRYARHMTLREIGGPGQKALKQARVLVVGAGGLGSPALQYLGAAGVGTLGLIDDDRVEAANLQRQTIHRDALIGLPKVESATDAITAQNPFVTVRPYNRRLTADVAAALFPDYDLILDGSDSFETRYLVNAAAVAAGKPVIGAALTQWEGQISIWDPAQGAPCYACVFPTAPDRALAPSCAEAGVLGPLPGILGTLMAAEAIKLITGAGEPLRGRLMLVDALYAETRTIAVSRRADCPVCGTVHRA